MILIHSDQVVGTFTAANFINECKNKCSVDACPDESHTWISTPDNPGYAHCHWCGNKAVIAAEECAYKWLDIFKSDFGHAEDIEDMAKLQVAEANEELARATAYKRECKRRMEFTYVEIHQFLRSDY